MGSLRRTYGSSGSFAVAWVLSNSISVRRVHWGLRDLTLARLSVVWNILFRVG